jgi:hypothetical protein
MIFKANLVKTNSTPAIHLSLIGIIVFLVSILLWQFEVPDDFAWTGTIGGLLMVLFGGVFSRNKPMFEVDEDLLEINELTIKIRERSFTLGDISGLEFFYHSYYSQSPSGYFTEPSGLIELGLNNKIGFTSNGEEITEMFYLADQEHADRFFSMLNMLRGNSIAYNYTYRI